VLDEPLHHAPAHDLVAPEVMRGIQGDDGEDPHAATED
jgi:hypothetical protein